MTEEKSSCIEDVCYECCWYGAKIYTYIQEYVCCCFCKTKEETVDETTSIAKDIKPDEYVKDKCNYGFLVIEIKVKNKAYVLKDYSEFMYDTNDFLTPHFVYNYLVSKKCVDNSGDLNSIPDYTINIIDDKSNFVTLDNNSYLSLKKDSYEKIVFHDE